MEFSENNVYLKTVSQYTEEDGCVVILQNDNKILLNLTASIVWKYINGYSTLNEICKNIILKYGENNNEDYIKEILYDSIKVLLENNLINKR